MKMVVDLHYELAWLESRGIGAVHNLEVLSELYGIIHGMAG